MSPKRTRTVAIGVLLAALPSFFVAGCGTETEVGQADARQLASSYEEVLEERYDEVFPDDRVLTVQIEMDDEDWLAMQEDVTAKEYYRADISIDGEIVEDVAVRTKGNSSLRAASSSEEFRAGLKVDFNFFNSARSFHGLKKIVYNNGFSDPTLMKEFLGYELMALAGVPAPRACFVDLWVNDVHLGVYTQVEAVDSYFVSENCADGDGNLYKPEVMAGSLDWTEEDLHGQDGAVSERTASTTASVDLGGGDLGEIIEGLGEDAGWIPGWAGEEQSGDEELPVRAAVPNGGGQRPLSPLAQARAERDSDYLTSVGLKTNEDNPDYSGLFELLAVLNSDPSDVSAKDLEEVLQVDEVLRFLAVSVTLVHLDNYIGMAHNYYLYEDGGEFWVIPWDLNMCFGGFNSGLSDAQILNFYIDEPTSAAVAEYPLVQQILDEPVYMETYHDYLQQLLDGPFSVERMNTRIDEIADLIRPYVREDTHMFFTLADFERGIDRSLDSRRSGVEARGGHFIGLKYFVAERTASIAAQLSGARLASKGDGSGNGGSKRAGGQDRPGALGDGVLPKAPPRQTRPSLPNGLPPTTLPEEQQ